MNTPPAASSLTSLVDEEYLRARLDPRPGDYLYLHLSDLRLALEKCRHHERLRVLDYGCGGSPYRTLFPGDPYHRADFPSVACLDYTLGQDSAISAPSSSYDLILSTQVFEHVARPESYLAECHRLLVPGGRLLISTHGTFEDHGCPYDYHRWTADGLSLALDRAGFQLQSLRKLTSGARALAFLARTRQAELVTADRSVLSLGLRLLQRILRKYPRQVDAFCDRAFPTRCRVFDVSAAERGPSLYIALLAVAVRRQS